MKETEKFKIQPLNGKVVIKADKPAEKSRGGIILPETHNDFVYGTVMAIPPNYYLPYLDKDGTAAMSTSNIEVDNRVVYINGSGIEIIVDDETYLILEEKEIYAIINK